MALKQAIRSMLRRCGLDVRRFRPASSEDARLAAALRVHAVNLVFDVGANTGQFGKLLREGGYRGRIVSFEPLSVARKELIRAAQRDPSWEIAEQAAVGSEEGRLELHVAGNSVSSSLLPMSPLHVSAAPESAYIASEVVPVRTLDQMARAYLRADSVPFLKIDTQGYEHKVLQGAGQLLKQAVGLQLELSLVPLYVGQRAYEELLGELKGQGFTLWGMSPAFIEPDSGRLLQIDATLFRS